MGWRRRSLPGPTPVVMPAVGLALMLVAACGVTADPEGASGLPPVTPTTYRVATTSTTSTSTTSTTLPPSTTAPPPTTSPGPPRTSCAAVVHLGDSTSVGLASEAVLPDPADRIDAQYVRVQVVDPRLAISGARAIVETLGDEANAEDVAAEIVAGGYDGCWVLALGTVDTANVAAGAGVERAERIDRMMAVVGDAPVLWVNVTTRETSGPWADENMRLWNDELLAAALRHPNLRVFDWAAVAEDDWFAGDGITYTPAGYAARARLIADALAANYPG